jgi:YggT family protein
MGLLATLARLYSLLIVIRIMLTWFGNAQYGRPVELLARITDPYLDWWRYKFNLRAGFLDLSPIAAMAALSIIQTVCSTMASQGRISLGIILAVCLSALWSAVSFILGFCLIVLALRLIGYLSNGNMYSPFWRVIDSISRPLLYRINRIIFGRRIVRYLTGIIAAMAALAVLWIVLRFAAQFLNGLLMRLPV